MAAERWKWKWGKEQSYEKPEDVSRKSIVKRGGRQGRAQTKMTEPKTET